MSVMRTTELMEGFSDGIGSGTLTHTAPAIGASATAAVVANANRKYLLATEGV